MAIKSQFGIQWTAIDGEEVDHLPFDIRGGGSISKARPRARSRGLIKNEIAAARFQGGRLDRASYLICNSCFSASFLGFERDSRPLWEKVWFRRTMTILRFRLTTHFVHSRDRWNAVVVRFSIARDVLCVFRFLSFFSIFPFYIYRPVERLGEFYRCNIARHVKCAGAARNGQRTRSVSFDVRAAIYCDRSIVLLTKYQPVRLIFNALRPAHQ